MMSGVRGEAHHMMRTSRRDFLLAAAAASGMARGSSTRGALDPASPIRPPLLGQSWRYARHDYVTGAMLDTQIDRLAAIGKSIVIESTTEGAEAAPITYPSLGDGWWRQYMGATAVRSGAPVEVHQPWGMVVVDPHWSDLQSFEKPMPLWPSELRPGWSATVDTRYMIPTSSQVMPWQVTLHAKRWESVTVPAGRFTALRCYSLIDFRYTNVSERVAGQRQENLWFVPEIGRWAARESWGTFYQDVGERFHESSHRWELLGWT